MDHSLRCIIIEISWCMIGCEKVLVGNSRFDLLVKYGRLETCEVFTHENQVGIMLIERWPCESSESRVKKENQWHID